MVRQLAVQRRLADGSCVPVGMLAQNQQGVFFQYADSYLQRFPSLSPFNLAFSNVLQLAPTSPHGGLHGVFADTLPDGWGLLLMDRVFRQAGLLSSQISAMDRLAFVGERGSGALIYQPASALQPAAVETLQRLADLGKQAQLLFEGETSEVLNALVNSGNSGGARPKAQLYFADADDNTCSTLPNASMSPWLVKFTAASLPLGHEEGMCEAAYLDMAGRAGISVPQWKLLAAQKRPVRHWLALRRFDYTAQGGRLHLHSACGLLDADFRLPALDYDTLIKASGLLCKSPAAAQQQFRRAVFNLFALNQDDHSKNWAFLQDDTGAWHLAPFYDATFSPTMRGEHATAFAGYGKAPPRKVMQQLAESASYASWKQAHLVVDEVVSALSMWPQVAKECGVSVSTVKLIQQQMNTTYEQNKELLR
jgi:serine/threonine-protein kinase HipA